MERLPLNFQTEKICSEHKALEICLRISLKYTISIPYNAQSQNVNILLKENARHLTLENTKLPHIGFSGNVFFLMVTSKLNHFPGVESHAVWRALWYE